MNGIFFGFMSGVALHLYKDYQGVIQSDGYAVYEMYENKKGVLSVPAVSLKRL